MPLVRNEPLEIFAAWLCGWYERLASLRIRSGSMPVSARMAWRAQAHITRCDSTEVWRSAGGSSRGASISLLLSELGGLTVPPRTGGSPRSLGGSGRSGAAHSPGPAAVRDPGSVVDQAGPGGRQHPAAGQADADRGPAAGGGEQAVAAAGHLHALAHAGQAEVAAAGQPVHAGRVEADAVVAHLHVDAVDVGAQVDPNVVRARVLGDVDERLLRHAVQHRLDLRFQPRVTVGVQEAHDAGAPLEGVELVGQGQAEPQ